MLGKGLGSPFETEPVRQIVGVVGDVHDTELSAAPAPATYIPQAQIADPLMSWIARATFTTWVVRAGPEPYALAGAVARTLQEVSLGVPVSDVRSIDDVIAQSRTRPTFNTVVLTIFGGAALLLATVGIYGLMSYSVQQRVPEIGIRIALGAGTGRVRRMVIWQGMRLVLLGMAIGLVAAYAVTQVLTGFLFGIGARDPMTFIVVPVLLAAIALVALSLPARAACRVNPIVALRAD